MITTNKRQKNNDVSQQERKAVAEKPFESELEAMYFKAKKKNPKLVFSEWLRL